IVDARALASDCDVVHVAVDVGLRGAKRADDLLGGILHAESGVPLELLGNTDRRPKSSDDVTGTLRACRAWRKAAQDGHADKQQGHLCEFACDHSFLSYDELGL